MINSYQEKLRQVIHITKEELTKIQKSGAAYSLSFPEDVRAGLACFNVDSKKLSTECFIFLSSTSRSLLKIDSEFLKISSIISDADKNIDIECINTCDTLLKTYDDFRKSINSFIQKNDKEIASKKISASRMLGYFSELTYKINYFLQYLNSLSI